MIKFTPGLKTKVNNGQNCNMSQCTNTCELKTVNFDFEKRL